MRVLLAIDHNKYSQSVVDEASGRLWPRGTAFKIVTALEPLELSADEFGEHSIPHMLENARCYRHKVSTKLCQQAMSKILAARPDVSVCWEIKEGCAPDVIIDAARAWGADRILLGARPTDMCPRYLSGSIFSDVVSHAPCSVEIVRKAAHVRKHTA